MCLTFQNGFDLLRIWKQLMYPLRHSRNDSRQDLPQACVAVQDLVSMQNLKVYSYCLQFPCDSGLLRMMKQLLYFKIHPRICWPTFWSSLSCDAQELGLALHAVLKEIGLALWNDLSLWRVLKQRMYLEIYPRISWPSFWNGHPRSSQWKWALLSRTIGLFAHVGAGDVLRHSPKDQLTILLEQLSMQVSKEMSHCFLGFLGLCAC